MNWNDWVRSELDSIISNHQLRTTRPVPDAINFASNDYLGLSEDLSVIAAVASAHDVGRGSPLVCGYTDLHRELERRLATLKSRESALLFSTGYSANLSVLAALSSEQVHIFSDELNHASIVDGCSLAKRKAATVSVYRHGDMGHLGALLEESRAPRKLVVTDSVFSMEGDIAPLREIVDLADDHDAWCMVDEAHATLVFGEDGGGVSQACGVSERIQIHVGTLSKAFGLLGGFVCSSDETRSLLVNRARPYIYSTALPVSIVAGALASLDAASDGGLRAKLWENVRYFERQFDVVAESPIVSIAAENESAALDLSAALLRGGVFAPAIRPPTVPTSRIRIAFTARHSVEEIDRLVALLIDGK